LYLQHSKFLEIEAATCPEKPTQKEEQKREAQLKTHAKMEVA
jgi:hypothetical protein